MIRTRDSVLARVRTVALLVCLAVLPVLHGCDGSEPTPKESQSDARGAEYFEQQAGAVSRALEDGRFGPRADVLVEMEAAAKEETIVDETTFEETVPRFFGRILPWNEMNEDQQDAFITWINGSERVQAAVGDEFTRILNDLKLERSAAD